MLNHHLAAVRLAGIALLCAASERADAQVYTNFNLYRAAIGGAPEYLHTFDDLAPNTTLTTQYAGVSFGGTARTWDAISEGGGGTAVSPRNVLFNFGTAPMRFTFNEPTRMVAVYNPSIFDVVRLTIRRADNTVIQTIDMPTGTVTFAGYIATENIAAVEAVGLAGQSNGTIFLDNLEFGSGCARIALNPAGTGTCPGGSGSLVAVVAGLSPRTLRWQYEALPVGSGDWHDLFDGPIPGSDAAAANTDQPSLAISNAQLTQQRFRLKVSNHCAAQVSNPATLRVCVADFNCDGSVDDADFLVFVTAYNLLACEDPAMPPGCAPDLNRDGVVDDADFVLFVAAYNDLLCP
ncbi:MAG: hypothetical protein JSS51_14365 [Planctomycetes bacterium]|nr:hypothetical protein [Planctomycetota bacterium]